ncbi:D-alanyl-D-alanine carboxypeptidase/D-alanyl-D-alanine-endopeptidase [Hoyosella sp. G463]|uniref:D-alanyl-D-alanine carboxypeptidase/D-alanyl-D-alanine-endopeptidase n=1 Tax=Lolliginicoccus lacisalsi TaxID=2742202 RepID=A0A927JEZ7_9ACTN|nr:D-alanyl-D-alanine carboxypeptidase/D-alanyl-D-alanine-endopeptidase [Lolliginicoccus lacisalsi]MBD8507282.1 D-alanyl-D-alanine carboxypeptidase/D-alanyl-D-alanine-endopeptidase [Lolliginicoccus lacisalsi]
MDDPSASSGPPSQDDAEPGDLVVASGGSPRPRLMVLAIIVVLAVLGATSIAVGARYVQGYQDSRDFTVDPAPALAVPAIEVPAAAWEDSPLDGSGVAAALDQLAEDPALGSLAGHVSDPYTRTVLWARDPAEPRTPASATKVLTAAAALLALPLDQRVSTRVIEGPGPGELILASEGDVTLGSRPAGEATYYEGAARLDDLVAQLRAAGAEASRIVVDASAFSGPAMARGWEDASISEGYITPMEPVMLDGGRIIPTEPESPRHTEPALAAGQQLAERLGLPAASVVVADAEGLTTDGRVLAEVASAPLLTRLRQLMHESDNVLAEAVGREIAIAEDEPPSFRGVARAIRAVLARNGFITEGLELEDASGLSTSNRITVALLDSVLSAAVGTVGRASGEASEIDSAAALRTVRLRPLLDLLPVAAGSGTLAERFIGDSSAGGAGWIRAKTGTLDGVSALVGYAATTNGRIVTFAFLSTESNAFEARPALDTAAARLRDIAVTDSAATPDDGGN